MPALLQLTDRRRTGNIQERQEARGNAQTCVNTHSSLNNTGEGDREIEKKQFEKNGGQ
ncbi:hypothetical protein BFJ63_vAg16055 [Fusarium oxysporum f. sp. narcissi]|uniref:Uncharacterized protein n=1 Tax=Fusarium oxysporum f. sp. narcissi TaxID=451672 RepID=A0A4Q2V313_FUSOX|nr:hypothetical protein BFJ63_vAg16055 [Fusarium oxysporum f. sp. narcissi]